MPRSLSAATLGALLLAAPLHAQGRPPEFLAQQIGAEPCETLARALGRRETWVAHYRIVEAQSSLSAGTTSANGEACFRTVDLCQRFLTELDLDYPGARNNLECAKGF